MIERLNSALEGRYRLLEQVGEGGMATVYLADDLKHERKVALKVLKPELAAVVGAERFLAEIRVTANLQHPNILPLFDSGEADGLLFYVMPLVEGESLRDRLEREKQLPVDEAVKIVTEVADALDHAHQKGVVHRDIKPANILLRGGRPLVADFGIALAVSAAGGGRLTETGLSLGTPHYMAPEQATADREVSPASDVYSLACVVYEMLVGEPPHTGPNARAVLTKILTDLPAPPRAIRASVPANVDAAIRRALEKLPADRFRSAREFAGALADSRFRYGEAGAESNTGAIAGRWNGLTLALAATSLLLAAALGWALLASTEASARPETRYLVPLREDTTAVYLGGGERDAQWGRPSSTSVAISPDGDLLVYAAWKPGGNGETQSRLYLRRRDREQAQPMQGTEGASNPFFSPRGDWIGFFAGSSLRQVAVAGGEPQTIVPDTHLPEEGPRGASWAEDGSIVYFGTDGLYRVAEGAGEATLVAQMDTLGPEFVRSAQPHMLPGSRVVLFHRWRSMDPERAEVVALNLETGRDSTVLRDAMDPRYVDTGQLLFMRQGTLWAVDFDLERLEVEGEPGIVLEDVMQAVGMPSSGWETGAAQLALSRSGHLAYASGGVFPAVSLELVRVGLDGVAEPLGLNREDYMPPRISPDGERLVFGVRSGWHQNYYVYDLRRDFPQTLNTGGFYDEWATWSPDGEAIVLTSDRDGPRNLYRMASDGSGEPERLAPSEQEQQPSSWSSEGVLAYLQGGDIWVLPPDGDPARFFSSPEAEEYPTFSPDGRWIAYTSEQLGSGQRELYVRPFPGPGLPVRVSTGHVESPAWSKDGRKLYYLEGTGDRHRMMVVDVIPGDPPQVGDPATLIDPWIYDLFGPVRGYDVQPDGSFLALLNEEIRGFREEASTLGVHPWMWRFRVGELHVILNFSEVLREQGEG
jgi:serine/threonine-protein kinase